MSGQPQDMGALYSERSAYICGTARRVITEAGVGRHNGSRGEKKNCPRWESSSGPPIHKYTLFRWTDFFILIESRYLNRNQPEQRVVVGFL